MSYTLQSGLVVLDQLIVDYNRGCSSQFLKSSIFGVETAPHWLSS